MKADIRSIDARQTWPVRQAVFGPDQPLTRAMLEDDARGRHLGVFVDEKLVAVASLFDEGNDGVRLRKMATLSDYQNLGLGSALLERVLGTCEAEGKRLWCAVRVEAIPFYARFGFRPVGDPYHKGNHQHQVIECEPDALSKAS